jgi:hypothetical protein
MEPQRPTNVPTVDPAVAAAVERAKEAFQAERAVKTARQAFEADKARQSAIEAERIRFGAMPEGQPVLKALQHLKKMEDGNARGLKMPTDFVPKSWLRRVIKNDLVDRRAWTLCLVDRLRGAIRRRDIFAAPSLRFADPRIGMLDGAEWQAAARPFAARSEEPKMSPRKSTAFPNGSATLTAWSRATCRTTPASASNKLTPATTSY